MNILKYSFRDTTYGMAMAMTLNDKLTNFEFCKDIEFLNSRYLERYFGFRPLEIDDTGTDLLLNKIFASFESGIITSDIEVDLTIKGTAFQQEVWRFLQTIPPGKCISYKEVAEGIGNSYAMRPVGTACKYNPIAYFVPCHRVIRSNGDLGGYRWGLDLKKRFLTREGYYVR